MDEQICEGCCRDFPGDDPMLSLADDGEFCSYGCLANWLSEGARDHCLTHDALVECYTNLAATLAHIFKDQ